jgi:hypothetical protein
MPLLLLSVVTWPDLNKPRLRCTKVGSWDAKAPDEQDYAADICGDVIELRSADQELL